MMKNHDDKNFRILPMTYADIDNLLVLWETCGLSISSRDREKIEMAHILQNNHDSCFIVRTKKEVIGCILGTFNGRRAWIYHVAVHPSWQRHGLGTQLMIKAEQELKKRGATKILLSILASNLEVFSFYKQAGYSVMNDAIVLEKDLFLKGEEYEKQD